MTTTPPRGTPSGVPETPDSVRAEYGAKLKTALSHMQFLKKQLTDEQERSAAARSLVDELRTAAEAHAVELDAANALATLVSASAVGDHFEDKYYAALRDAAGRRT